jgi:hypothetical protein
MGTGGLNGDVDMRGAGMRGIVADLRAPERKRAAKGVPVCVPEKESVLAAGCITQSAASAGGAANRAAARRKMPGAMTQCRVIATASYLPAQPFTAARRRR